MTLSIRDQANLPPQLPMDAAQCQVWADRRREPEHSSKSGSKLMLIHGDTVVCDLRDACQAIAFDNWNEQQPGLASEVTTVVLRSWLLWPRLRSTSWEKRIVDITITTETDGTNTIDLVELAECGVGEGQYHKDYYERCQCSMHELLADAKLDVKSIETMNGTHSTALESAEFVAQMIRNHHHARASARLLQGIIRTCGRQWNQCKRCKGSKLFLCKDDDIVVAALRTREPVKAVDAGIDGVQAQLLKFERGEPCERYGGQMSFGGAIGSEEEAGLGGVRRVVSELYDPFRYDKAAEEC